MALLRAFGAAFVLLAARAPRLRPALATASLVTTSWLAQHLHDPNLVLLHVGPKA